MKTIIRKTFILFFLLLPFHTIFSQVLTRKEFTKAVEKADMSYYFEEDYEKAAPQYESVLKDFPDNSNISAKLGICYLNIDGKKTDALKLLKKASLNVVSSSKEYIEYGEKAPLDTYLYLAIAYHQNDSLEKAVKLYYDARKKLGGTDLTREAYIDNQIRDCRYAMEMVKKPLTIISNLFATWLTVYPGACNPVISKNDSVFVFTVKKDGKTQILCSYKSGTWKRPVDITKKLGGYDRFYANSITGDGKLLVIFMDDGGDGNLYYSQRKDTIWTKIKSFGKPINTIYWEAHGFITPDGKSMYIASNRPGGEGELDIWVSKKTEEGSWDPPVNCGNVINTLYDENTPFYDPTTNALLFSSVGHISMGGYDVFRSVYRNGSWTNPIGMPFAFNTSMENTFFILNNNGPGFITSLYDEKNNSRNIYSIVAEDPASKITIASATISLQDGMTIDPKQIKIQLTDLKKGTLIKNIPLSDTSSFKFEIKPGDYQIFVSHTGYKTDTINLNVPLYFQGNYISLSASLVPDKVAGGDFLSIKNVLFEFDSYKINDQAKSILENLKSILILYPELIIEVAGYTDSKGSSQYNRNLADKRAQSVINYLSADVIPKTRFVKKAYGASNFESVNTNRDGTDNPEGRKYNRRATFGIVDPQTGITISQETYTPEHLRQPYSMRYSIVLLKTIKNLESGYFNSLKINELHFIKSIKIDSVTLYILGVFSNKNDASKYLAYAGEKGFRDAYIVTQYEINSASKFLTDPNARTSLTSDIKIYTIQIKATKRPMNISLFKGIKGVREIVFNDGYYRYVCGEYTSRSEAKAALSNLKKSGYKDAFIRELN